MSKPDGIEKYDSETAEYELLRIKHGASTWISIPQKLRWNSYALLALAGVSLLLWGLPNVILQTYFPAGPFWTPLAINVVGLLTVFIFILASGGLFWTAWRRQQLTEITTDQAWLLIGYEDIFSAAGFVTGLLGLVTTLSLAAVGYLGPTQYARAITLGIHPYATLGITLPAIVISLLSVVAALLSLSLGWYARRFEIDS